MGSKFAKPKREPRPPGDIICGLVEYRQSRRALEIVTSIGVEIYKIEADRILLSHEAFTDWIWQLFHKGWMSGQHFADFLECNFEVIYRDWEQWPQASYGVIGAIQGNPDRLNADDEH